jgi:hypothetical protein
MVPVLGGIVLGLDLLPNLMPDLGTGQAWVHNPGVQLLLIRATWTSVAVIMVAMLAWFLWSMSAYQLILGAGRRAQILAVLLGTVLLAAMSLIALSMAAHLASLT